MTKQKVIIIGAGLAGSLLSTYLAQRGIETAVYEARGDMREEETAAGRSINLALSDRGIRALREVGMDQYMLREAVPMYGRLIHPVAGETKLLPYSGREGEYINSVSRTGLNIALINQADDLPESRFYFHQKCVEFDCASGEVLLEDARTGERSTVTGETVIAADGAGSAVRRAMFSTKCVDRFDYSQKFLEHGYKELSIPPAVSMGSGGDPLNDTVSDTGVNPTAGADGSDLFRMEKNALHIWARHQFMMIALPNFDGSFTCTLFLAFEGSDSFEAINTGRWGKAESAGDAGEKHAAGGSAAARESLLGFFETYFPDAVPLMPDLVEEFFTNPTGNLGTIKCWPWNVGGRALLLGDSAHAIVPFYGQGMNAAFEDCRVFDELVEKHGTDWERVFEEYGRERKINTDAIADLAVENFFEMRDAVADPVFQKKRELETLLEQTYPDYFSKYSLVTFREDLPYAEAKRRGNAQDRFLMRMCEKIDDVGRVDLERVREEMAAVEDGKNGY